jgi:hypothetical protein
VIQCGQIRKFDRHRRPIFFKAHPIEVASASPNFAPLGIEQDVSNWTLDRALEGCYCLVTMSTNAAMFAALQGVPTLATDPGTEGGL